MRHGFRLAEQPSAAGEAPAGPVQVKLKQDPCTGDSNPERPCFGHAHPRCNWIYWRPARKGARWKPLGQVGELFDAADRRAIGLASK